MKWWIEHQEKLTDAPGYICVIAECNDNDEPTGTALSVVTNQEWDKEKVSEEEAVRNILRPLLERLVEYLGYKIVPAVSNN